jgi:hypothetical protein
MEATIKNVMVTSTGFGKQEGETQKSTLRHSLEEIEPNEYKR